MSTITVHTSHGICKQQNKTIILKNIYIGLILIILICTSIFVELRSYYREPVGDELLYQFILDEHPLGSNVLTHKVSNLNDALKSQSNQYFYSNGRFIIHVLVQMFSGVWGTDAYAIFLGLLVLSAIGLTGILCLNKSQRFNPLWWLVIAIIYLYLFQDNSRNWYSITGGFNYFFPIPLTLTCLLLLQQWKRNTPGIPLMIFCALIGFVTGWSHECFSLPLSVGLFITIVNRLIKRRYISTVWWILAISLWIGTLILVLAPGNFVRLGISPPLIVSIYHGIIFLIGTKLLWIMLLGVIVLRHIKKHTLTVFVHNNIIYIYTLVVAVCFGMVANTLPQSFNGISFYSALILLRLTSVLPAFNIKKSKTVLSITLIGLVVFSVHQVRIISYCKQIQKIHHEFVEQYKSSDDGTVIRPNIYLPIDVKPFCNIWFDSIVDWWLWLTLNEYYFKGQKELIIVDKADLHSSNEIERKSQYTTSQ